MKQTTHFQTRKRIEVIADDVDEMFAIQRLPKLFASSDRSTVLRRAVAWSITMTLLLHPVE